MDKKPDDLIEKYERKKNEIEKKNKKLKERYILVKDKWKIDTKDFVKEIKKFIAHINKDISPENMLELVEHKDDMYIGVFQLQEPLFHIKHSVKDIIGTVADEEISVVHGYDVKDFNPHEIEEAKKLFLKWMSDFNWASFEKDYGEF